MSVCPAIAARLLAGSLAEIWRAFLHLADVHLGFDRYNNPKRTTDFFLSLEDALIRYAIEPQVDFVVIAGDLFEHKVVQPAVLSHAMLALEMLQKAKIPAIAIEGNHDHRPYGSRSSWLRYLADWYGLICWNRSQRGPREKTVISRGIRKSTQAAISTLTAGACSGLLLVWLSRPANDSSFSC